MRVYARQALLWEPGSPWLGGSPHGNGLEKEATRCSSSSVLALLACGRGSRGLHASHRSLSRRWLSINPVGVPPVAISAWHRSICLCEPRTVPCHSVWFRGRGMWGGRHARVLGQIGSVSR